MKPIQLSKESKKVIENAEWFYRKTGKTRIALKSVDFRRLCSEYSGHKKPIDGELSINGINFYDGGLA